jgi:hypothetical protein
MTIPQYHSSTENAGDEFVVHTSVDPEVQDTEKGYEIPVPKKEKILFGSLRKIAKPQRRDPDDGQR